MGYMIGYIGGAGHTNPHIMKKFLLSLAVLSLPILMLVPSTALSQKSYAIGLGGGAAIPVGKLADRQATGYNALVSLAMGLSDLPFGFRFDGIYNNLSHTKSPPTGVTSTKLQVTALLANMVYAFPGTTAKAYIIAGGGLYKSKADVDGAKSKNDWGFNAGLGATFGFGPIATFIESRYHTVSRNEADGGVYQFVPITLGFMF
jgi:hypothetical protein